jgi:hypothetical protein
LKPLEVFRPSPGEPLAGVIASAVVSVVGLSMLGFVVRDFLTSTRPRTFSGPGLSWFLVAVLVFVGIVLLLLGLGLAVRSRLVLSFRVELYPGGLRVVDYSGACDFHWDDLDSILEENVRDYLPVLDAAPGVAVGLPVGKSLYLTLERADGLRYRIEPGKVQNIERLRDVLRQEAERLGVPWRVADQDAGPIHTPFSGK